ncbi:MAG: preprotein translocase subunit SecY [Candidatus Paceibacterota bacterium]|jgi:preprotein translocase subunit SecY|nr:preprotein translocase subunit SecY [Candidatus Paceibacterota bacterium]MDD5621079.1 preprotein translocase subunit SecY [Candidatus Paceibacterota bacterium]
MALLNQFTQIFKIKDLRKKIFFILLLFVVFRIMSGIPMPGVDTTYLAEFFNKFQALGFANVLSGGALSTISIAMLGLGPYITAIIIFELLTLIFPSLQKMYKEEGEAGRKKFNQYARIATIPLAAMEAYGMLTLFKSQGAISIDSGLTLLTSIITVTAGSVFLMWLGELITEKGIGNGVSLLIFAGIVARFPISILEAIRGGTRDQLPAYLFFIAAIVIIVFGVVLITEGRRNIPVSYAKRVRGNKMYGGVSTYLPMNINPAGVIPIIFAMSILMIPGMVTNFIGKGSGIAQNISNFFSNGWSHGIMYFALVFAFTFFYTMVTFDPKSISENLQKMGGFVPGIRPGPSTAKYIAFILHRVLFIGALFLALIAVLPSIIEGLTNITSFSFLLGGTSVLIIVSVVLDTIKQINSQLQMREYEKI